MHPDKAVFLDRFPRINTRTATGGGKMVGDIFLIYVNCSLKENPEKLYEVFEHFKSLGIDMCNIEKKVGRIIDHFIAFAKCDDLKSASLLMKERINRSASEFMHGEIRMAFEAVFGYRDNYCEAKCQYKHERIALLSNKLFSGPERLKCHECYQLFFKSLLLGLVQGKEYSEIGSSFESLSILLLNSHLDFNTSVINKRETSPRSPFKEKLEVSMFYVPRVFDVVDNEYRECLNRFVLGTLVSFSLSEFLLHNDRRKLKKCPYCEKFFIAKSIKRERCYSDNCRKEYERSKKRKQRETDLAKYY